MPVLTAADWRAGWFPQLTGTGEDTQIALFIARAEGSMAGYLGYPPASVGTEPTVLSASYTRYFGAEDVTRGGRLLRLDVLPVTAITSIYDDPDHEWEAADLVQASDYSILDGNEGLVLLAATSAHGFWNQGDGNIKVTFTAGYTTATARIVQAVGMLTLHYWQLRSTQGFSTVPQGAGSASPRDETIPAAIKELLDPMRLPRVLL